MNQEFFDPSEEVNRAYYAGREDGYKDGYNDGYKEGYNEGRYDAE